MTEEERKERKRISNAKWYAKTKEARKAYRVAHRDQRRVIALKYRQENAERIKTLQKIWQQSERGRQRSSISTMKWRREHPEKYRAYIARYTEREAGRIAAHRAEYREKNPGKLNALCAKYRATRLNATPGWLSETQIASMAAMYFAAQRWGETVDHIVPLQNSTVCGLHVPWNLRVIPSTENIKKGNKLPAEDLMIYYGARGYRYGMGGCMHDG